MKIILMAWRNLWSNRKRTIITAASLYFAVVFAIITRSMQLGTYDVMIDGAVKAYSGYIQIQDSMFFKENSLDYLIPYDESFASSIDSVPGVFSALPRLETFSLVSNGTKTKVVVLQGINPVSDNAMTGMSKHLISGEYLDSLSDGVLVSSRLATYLNVKLGDTLVLISQGYQGATAANQYPIRGIVRIPSPALDNKLIIMNLWQIQDFANAYDMVTSVAINIKDKNDIDQVADVLKAHFQNSSLQVLKWTDLDKVLKQQIESDNSSGIIMLIILYMVIFFGILGTIIMMTSERIREFGVMRALGMKSSKMILMMLFETLFIGLLGILSGVITTTPIIAYFMHHPIRLGGEMAQAFEVYGIEPVMAFSPDPLIFINQIYIVFVLMIITLIYPVAKLIKLNIINSLRG